MRAVSIDPAATRPLRQAVLRPHESLVELAEHETPGSFAAGVPGEDAELVAVGLISPDGTPGGWRIRGMATAPGWRSRGAGGAVLVALLEHARAAGAERIWCNARIPAVTLYERAGLRVVSDEFEIEPIGPHVVMEWRGGAPRGATPTTVSAGPPAPRQHGSRA